MPPWTRSKRVKYTEIKSLSGKEFNSKGFASLPSEIYGEIASHIPTVPVSCHTIQECDEYTSLNPSTENCERHFTLHSLSQTSRYLRPIFLRYLWKTIEVFDGLLLIDGRRLPEWQQRILAGDNSITLKLYTQELLRQLEIVTVRNPSLAQYVNSINVLIPLYSLHAVCEELLCSMSLLPNLRTVRLYCGTTSSGSSYNAQATMAKIVQESPHQFPQVRHAYVEKVTVPFTSKCPNLLSLSSTVEFKWSYYQPNGELWWQVIDEQVASHIEILGIMSFHKTLSSGLLCFPNLRDITLDVSLVKRLIAVKYDLATRHKRLQVIRIRADQLDLRPVFHHTTGYKLVIPRAPKSEIVEAWVDWAEGCLRRIQNHDNLVKNIFLTMHGGERIVYRLEPGLESRSIIRDTNMY